MHDLSIPPPAGPEQIYRLWDELHGFSASNADQALQHLLETLSGWLGAGQAYWAATACFPENANRPDGLLGWRVCAMRALHPPTAAALKLLQEVRRQRAAGAVDAGDTTRVLVTGAGMYRTNRLHDGFVDFESFRRTPHYRVYYEPLGITDRLWSICPVSPNAEAYFFFDLLNTEHRFSAADAALVATTLRGVHALLLRLFLSHGVVIARKPLTRTQRKIVHHLLTDKTEREIAAETQQSPATTHKHIETIYRAFGVNSRAALMALWLAGG